MPEQSQEERMAEARMIGQAVVDGGGSLSDAQDKMLEFFNQGSLKDQLEGGLEPNPLPEDWPLVAKNGQWMPHLKAVSGSPKYHIG
jgi:hypothetical protein